MNTEGWGEAVRDGLAEGMRRAEAERQNPHNPWPDGLVSALNMPEPEPRTALARWDAAEGSTGRKLQPLTEDQSRFCLHPSADHGILGCNTCGCPRSEDDHLGTLCRWPAHEDASAPEPWVWRPGWHLGRFPHGMAFEPKRAEPPEIQAATGSLLDILGNPSANIGLMYALDSEGGKTGEPVELLGPFHLMHEHGRMVEFIAWGGVRHDPHVHVMFARPEGVQARAMRLTKLDAQGNPTGPSVALSGVRNALVSLAPALEETAVALNHLGRAAITVTLNMKRFAYSRLVNAFYTSDRMLVWVAGRAVWVHRSWVRPGPAMGLTRRQRRSTRRIHRRGA